MPSRSTRFTESVSFLTGLLVDVYKITKKLFRVTFSDADLVLMYPPGKLGFKQEGSGKLRIFAIPNALKQALLRSAHDWAMSVLRTI